MVQRISIFLPRNRKVATYQKDGWIRETEVEECKGEAVDGEENCQLGVSRLCLSHLRTWDK